MRNQLNLSHPAQTQLIQEVPLPSIQPEKLLERASVQIEVTIQISELHIGA